MIGKLGKARDVKWVVAAYRSTSGSGLTPLTAFLTNTHPPPQIAIVATSRYTMPILARTGLPNRFDFKGKSRNVPIEHTPTMLKKFHHSPLNARVRIVKLGTLKSFISDELLASWTQEELFSGGTLTVSVEPTGGREKREKSHDVPVISKNMTHSFQLRSVHRQLTNSK
jgi:hypothetical protein